MTTEKIAKRLVELCRQGQFEEAQVELYADNATSKEPDGAPLSNAKSREEVIEGGRKFRASLDKVHGLVISDPIITGSMFAVTFALDADFKGSGRALFEEICSFKVKDGKIVQSQYFY